MNRHMKAEDLQIGDWVQLFPDQCRVDGIICLREVHTAEEKWMAIVHLGGNKYERVNVDILEPIPLTHDILEKNGFTNYDVGHKVKGWTIMDEEYCSDIPFTLTDNDFDTEQGDYKWGPVEDDREESFVREAGRIKYVHELQRILKVCGVNKEIVL